MSTEMTAGIIVGVAAVWVLCGWLSFVINTRASFWRYPFIWLPNMNRAEYIMFALFGPIGLIATVTVVGYKYKPIPSEAFQLKPGEDTATKRERRALECLAHRLRGIR